MNRAKVSPMLCREWGEPCPKGLHQKKVQSVCLVCWAERLSHAAKGENMKKEKYQYKGIVHLVEPDEDQPVGGVF